MADAAEGAAADAGGEEEPEEEPGIPAASIPADYQKHLVACRRCGLVKTIDQFLGEGCDNCPFLSIQHDRARLSDCTTKNFNGMVAQMNPDRSWASRWLRKQKLLPGCYALSVSDELPADIRAELEDRAA